MTIDDDPKNDLPPRSYPLWIRNALIALGIGVVAFLALAERWFQ